MKLRIVVADQSEVDFYDMQHAEEIPTFAGGLGDPIAHLHDRDLKSDRPGRVFDHAAAPFARRGSTAHHGTGSERTPRKIEAEQFARRIVQAIEGAHRDGAFERLVLIAPPGFLGLIRRALPDSLHALVTAEIGKDLVHAPPSRLRSYLSPELFAVHIPPG